jgi:hypothetical protein
MQANVLVIRPESITWSPIDDAAEMAVLSGDPEANATFTIRYRTFREIIVPPHWHPCDEHITVLDGPFSIGFGESLDPGSLVSLAEGAYVEIPARTAHFTVYGAGTIVQVSGMGPFKTIYVDAAKTSI